MNLFAALFAVGYLSVLACAQGSGALQELRQIYDEQAEAEDPGRHSTLEKIGRLQSEGAVRFLLEVLDEAPASDVETIVTALGETRHPRAFKKLAEMAVDTGAAPGVIGRAIGAIAGFDSPSPVSTFRKVAEGPQPYFARDATKALIARLESERTPQRERQQIQKALLELAFDSKHGTVRAVAVAGVDGRVFEGEGSALAPTQWRKQLRARIRKEKDGPTLAAMLSALARQAVAQDFALVASHCKHKEHEVRLIALESLDVYERTPEELISHYLHALTDEELRIRKAAYSGLRGTRDRRVVEKAMHAVVEDVDPGVRQIAAELLASSQDPRAPERLLVGLTLALQQHARTPQASQGLMRRASETLARCLARSLTTDTVEFIATKATEATDPWVRLAAVQALAQCILPEAGAALLTAVRDTDLRVALAAVDGIRGSFCEGGVEALVEGARAARSRPLHLACIEALGVIGMGDPLANEYLLEALDHPVVEVSLSAIEAVGHGRVEAAVPRLAELLHHERWQVRSAAIASLRSIRVKACVEGLLTRLPLEDGKLRPEILRALKHITGQQLGDDHELWDSWWATVGDHWVVPSLDDLAIEGDATSAGGTYYGIPVVSTRLAFVLDKSGSMGVSTKTSEGAPSTRMEVAKAELIKVVDGLRSPAVFNIVLFATAVDSWERKLTLATSKYRKQAASFVSRQGPGGGPNIYDALERAFEDPLVDTIYLLTDGQPSAGAFTAPADVRREVARMNRTRRVTIHCISVGTDSKLLQNLASDSGGAYVAHP